MNVYQLTVMLSFNRQIVDVPDVRMGAVTGTQMPWEQIPGGQCRCSTPGAPIVGKAKWWIAWGLIPLGLIPEIPIPGFKMTMVTEIVCFALESE